MNIGAPYSLKTTEVAELVRIALTKHQSPVSRVMRIAIKFLRDNSPGLRLLVSYADPSEGHHGGVYQACGWVYEGPCAEATLFFHCGKWKHQREVTAVSFASTGQPGSGKVANVRSLPQKKTPGKHKYLLPLDDAMRAQIAPLAKPYPKRPVDSKA
ncbi:MAG: protein Mom [Planctomycetes bacterium]|nr:protein Mom [Planctomycetota bacterium]